ncbi:MAG TPA: MogA/MoaB family molybdenum cofactor biosynthesis protein [Myxococcaceae bacterium]|nr:MogA/MoaB family molybdenum cofactor biosynthesis protein [Myxococcaceae bacterium]
MGHERKNERGHQPGAAGGDHRHGHAVGHQEHGHSHAADEHKSRAPAQVATYVITCSDSRNAQSDESGQAIQRALEQAGHTVCGYSVVRDEPEAIRECLEDAGAKGARAVILNGGTGIGRRDNTVEVLEQLFDKRLPGFGELFRSLSFKEIGSPAMMSRATAGTYRGMIIFALPGSPQAARLAMDELILPELGHAVRELTR